MTQLPILTEKEQAFCEYWLSSYTRMWADLTHSRFTPYTLQCLILYEAHTRKRKKVIERLVGRLYRLKKEKVLRMLDYVLKRPRAANLLLIQMNKDDRSLREALDEGDRN